MQESPKTIETHGRGAQRTQGSRGQVPQGGRGPWRPVSPWAPMGPWGPMGPWTPSNLPYTVYFGHFSEFFWKFFGPFLAIFV